MKTKLFLKFILVSRKTRNGKGYSYENVLIKGRAKDTGPHELLLRWES